MTVQTTAARADYSGNGVTTSFAVPFYFLDPTHLSVVLVQAAPTLIEPKVLTLNSDYTVSGAGNEQGGTVTVNVAPASGTTLAIVRNVPFTQLVHYVENDPFPAATHEQALDQLTMEAQQLATLQGSSLQFPQFETASPTLAPAAQRANMLLGFDASGNPAYYPLPTYSAPSPGTMYVETFAANVGFVPGTTTSLTLANSYGIAANVSIHFDTTWIAPSQYALVGRQLVFTAPIPSGTNMIYVRGGTTIPVGTLTGVVGADNIAQGAITAGAIAPGAVGADSLATGSVTAGAIAPGAVGADSLATGSVTAGAIAPGAVTGSLGFTPVQQGGGTNMTSNNKVRLGWSAQNQLLAQVDSTPLGQLWTSTTLTKVSQLTNDAGYLGSGYIDNTNATSDLALGVGQTAIIDVSAATTVPLHIATGDLQSYEIDFLLNGTTGSSTSTYTVLLPNNTTYTNYFFGQILTGVNSAAQAGSTYVSGFLLAHADIRNATTRVSTRTASKTAVTTALGYSSAPYFYASVYASSWLGTASTSTTNDSSTVWSSLGTVAFPVATTGRIIIKRIA